MTATPGWLQATHALALANLRRRLAPVPDLVVLGHVSRDCIGAHQRLGGAAAFAARAAACLGVRTGLVTAAPAGFHLMGPLRHDRNIALRTLACPRETSFALDYTGPVRRIQLLHRAPDLTVADVPPRFLRASLAYVAPVIGECGRDILAALQAQLVVVGAQGWMRAVDGHGRLVPALAAELLEPPKNVRVMVFSELDHPEAEAVARHLAGREVMVALTRGCAGVTLFDGRSRYDVPAQSADEVDPTGAGDVFGVVFALALHGGFGLLAAAQQAALAAARTVEGAGLGNLAYAPVLLEPLRSCS